MSKYNSFKSFGLAIAALPAVRVLFAHHQQKPAVNYVLKKAFAEALADSIESWYTARAYRWMSDDKTSGYPGDRAVFSLALKSGFLGIRYAWPKQDVDRALEAIAQAMPDTDEFDSYEEMKEKKDQLAKRVSLLEMPGGLASEDSQDPAGPTPGCDCSYCRSLRDGKLLPDDDSDGAPQLPPGLPPQLRELLEKLKGAIQGNAPESTQTRREIVSAEGDAIRAAIKEGNLEETLRQAFEQAPIEPTPRALWTTFGLLGALGYGDVLADYAAAVRAILPGFQDFQPNPIPGSPMAIEISALVEKLQTRLDEPA